MGDQGSGLVGEPAGRPRKRRRLLALLAALGGLVLIALIVVGVLFFFFNDDGPTHDTSTPLTSFLPSASAGYVQQPQPGGEQRTLDQLVDTLADQGKTDQTRTLLRGAGFNRAAERLIANPNGSAVDFILVQFDDSGGAKDFLGKFNNMASKDNQASMTSIDVANASRYVVKDSSDGRFSQVVVTRVGDVVAFVLVDNPGRQNDLLAKLATQSVRMKLGA